MLSGPVQPLVQYLSQPDRLTIDLPDTQLPPQWNQHDVTFSDSRLQTIQVRQSQANKVQLTLALQAVQDYRISVQSAPDRITVELLGTVTTVSPDVRTAQKGPLEVNAAEPSARVAVSPRTHLTPLIFIDPGHGGHDPGALGPTGPKKDRGLASCARIATINTAGDAAVSRAPHTGPGCLYPTDGASQNGE